MSWFGEQLELSLNRTPDTKSDRVPECTQTQVHERSVLADVQNPSEEVLLIEGMEDAFCDHQEGNTFLPAEYPAQGAASRSSQEASALTSQHGIRSEESTSCMQVLPPKGA